MAMKSDDQTRIKLVMPLLQPRQREVYLALEAEGMGSDGFEKVAELSGTTPSRLKVALDGYRENQRRKNPAFQAGTRQGTERKSILEEQPGLLQELEKVLEEHCGAGAGSVLVWTTDSMNSIRKELAMRGYVASVQALGPIVDELGYTRFWSRHGVETPEALDQRIRTYEFIDSMVTQNLEMGNPVVFLDTRFKKERDAGDFLGFVEPSFVLDDPAYVPVPMSDQVSSVAFDCLVGWWGTERKGFAHPEKVVVIGAGSHGDKGVGEHWELSMQSFVNANAIPVDAAYMPYGIRKWRNDHPELAVVERATVGNGVVACVACVVLRPGEKPVDLVALEALEGKRGRRRRTSSGMKAKDSGEFRQPAAAFVESGDAGAQGSATAAPSSDSIQPGTAAPAQGRPANEAAELPLAGSTPGTGVQPKELGIAPEVSGPTENDREVQCASPDAGHNAETVLDSQVGTQEVTAAANSAAISDAAGRKGATPQADKGSEAKAQSEAGDGTEASRRPVNGNAPERRESGVAASGEDVTGSVSEAEKPALNAAEHPVAGVGQAPPSGDAGKPKPRKATKRTEKKVVAKVKKARTTEPSASDADETVAVVGAPKPDEALAKINEMPIGSSGVTQLSVAEDGPAPLAEAEKSDKVAVQLGTGKAPTKAGPVFSETADALVSAADGTRDTSSNDVMAKPNSKKAAAEAESASSEAADVADSATDATQRVLFGAEAVEKAKMAPAKAGAIASETVDDAVQVLSATGVEESKAKKIVSKPRTRKAPTKAGAVVSEAPDAPVAADVAQQASSATEADEPKAKKATKPRARKAAAKADAAPSEGVEIHVAQQASSATEVDEPKAKKATKPRTRKAPTKAGAVVSEAPDAPVAADVAQQASSATEADEPKAKKATKPRARKAAAKADAAPSEGVEIHVAQRAPSAAEAEEPKAKKATKPRARKAAANADAAPSEAVEIHAVERAPSAAEADEPKAKKATKPRARKAAANADGVLSETAEIHAAERAPSAAEVEEPKAKKATKPRARKAAAKADAASPEATDPAAPATDPSRQGEAAAQTVGESVPHEEAAAGSAPRRTTKSRSRRAAQATTAHDADPTSDGAGTTQQADPAGEARS